MGVKMKTKFLLFACILFALMLFACAESGDVDDAGNVVETSVSAKEGVVTISFAVETEGVAAKAISITNPNFSDKLIFQYKAKPEFKLANGSEPVGTANDWTVIKDYMSFSVGKWTLDVRVIEKGMGNNSDIIVYQTDAPITADITASSDKLITFSVKELPANTGNLYVNVAVRGQGWNKGKMSIILNNVLDGKEQEIEGNPIEEGDFDGKEKLFFRKGFKNIPVGLYTVTLSYQHAPKEPHYKYLIPNIMEIAVGEETKIEGEFDGEKLPDPLNDPFVTYFSGNDGNKKLEGSVSVDKLTFEKDKDIVLTFQGKVSDVSQQINKEITKIPLNNIAIKKQLEENKVDNQVKQVKQVKQQEQKVAIQYKIYVDDEMVQDFSTITSYTFKGGLKSGEHKIGVKVQGLPSKVSTSIEPFTITVK